MEFVSPFSDACAVFDIYPVRRARQIQKIEMFVVIANIRFGLFPGFTNWL
jgi:hypothetical protein